MHYQYIWPFDNRSGDSIKIKVYNSGWHEVILYDSCTAAPATDSVFVYMIPQAKAAFDFIPASPVQIKNPVRFVNNSQNASSYLWTFGTGDSSRLISPVYSYKDSSLYKLTLIAYGLHNCPNDTAHGIIKTIDRVFEIFIPNAFSPNGDGKNDFFDVNGVSIADYKYSIYNRWGENIFNFTSTRNTALGPAGTGWDGTYKSKPVPEGVYIYELDILDVLGEHHYLSGNITLMR